MSLSHPFVVWIQLTAQTHADLQRKRGMESIK